MDLNTVRGLSTILVMIAFFGVCWWAFSPSRKKKFEEAANLPFADDRDVANDKTLHRTDEEKRQD